MRAVNEDGCNVVGYAARSLTDSFEWGDGYRQDAVVWLGTAEGWAVIKRLARCCSLKYGIAKVDFDSPDRTRSLKTSAAAFLRNVLTSRQVDYVPITSS